MKNIFYLLILVLCSFACKETFVSEQEIAESTQNNITAVRVGQPTLSEDPIPIEASGIVGSKTELNLSFKIGGFIEQLNIRENQRVKKGQVLATLRTTEIDAQVMKAKQAVQKAERDVVRIQNMYADSVATRENVDDLTTQLEVTKSDLAIAEFNQQYAKIIAPVSGRVIKRFAEANELINPGQPVFQIASNDGKGFVLTIGVADKDVIQLKRGDRAEVQFDAFPNQIIPASLTEISESADARTGVFPIELTLAYQKGVQLRNGFIGKVKLYPSNIAPYYKIPINALVEGYRDKANIYSVENNRAKKLSIQPLYIGKDFFSISKNQLKGLPIIITDGAAYVKEGMEVKVVGEQVAGGRVASEQVNN